MTDEADRAAADESLGMKLLHDLRVVLDGYDKPAVASADLVEWLRKLEDSPWDKFDFKQTDLARRLKPYNVRPERVRPAGGRDSPQVRGYHVEHLQDLFRRYLPSTDADDEPDPSNPSSHRVTPSHSQVNPGTPQDAVTGKGVTPNGPVTGLTSQCDGVTACDTTPDGGGSSDLEDLGAWTSDVSYDEAVETLVREFGAHTLTGPELVEDEMASIARWNRAVYGEPQP
jgi:hypothetical protein